MANQQSSAEKSCTDVQSGRALLPPDAHDLTIVDQKPKLNLDSCGVYWVKRKCTRDGCEGGFKGMKPIGRTIGSEQDYRNIAYELYESYYENPRQISYPAVQALVRKRNPGARNAITDNLSDAAKLGRLDAEEDRNKRMKQEVLNTALSSDS